MVLRNVITHRKSCKRKGTQTVHSKKESWLKSWPKDVPKKLNFPNVPLFGLVSEAANKHGANPAIAFLDREISYAELDALSSRFAAALSTLGVGKADRVALFLPNIPQFVIAYYGILKVGAVLTTISPLHREREVEYQLASSEAETIVTLDSLFQIVNAVKQKTKLKNVITTSIEEFAKTQEQTTCSFRRLLNQQNPNPPKIQIAPVKDLAALQYTGGTTGTAKAVMLTHANLVSNAVAFAAWLKCSSEDVFLAALPLFHIYGMTTSLNAAVAAAAKIVLLPRFETQKAIEAIQLYKVTVFCGVPTMYQALLANPGIRKFNLTSIRVCISGAAPLPPQVQKQFMEVTGGLLAEGYGLTEASPVTHCSPVKGPMRTVRVGSIGLPLPNTEARIVDSETGTKLLKAGETGELAVRGPQVMKGYWRNPAETALVLLDGWLLTGDLARIEGDGYFYITDRKKDLIKYNGYSVYPREIEDVLYEHPAVKLCAVVGKPDVTRGEVPKAFVILKEGMTATTEEIAGFANSRVAAYKAIREVVFRKELPLSGAGKVLRRELKGK